MTADVSFHPTFVAWYADAIAQEPRVPDAMQLATVDADGLPNVRTVLMKDHDPLGFTFYTNLGSRKATELGAVPHAALCFHWKSLERQVLVRGHVQPVPDAVADAYFATRPRGSQLGAWASRQSAPLQQPHDLAQAVADAEQRFEGVEVPRPSHWSGFRLSPSRVEFWQGRPSRLHERTVYTLGASGWQVHLEQP